LVIFKYWIPVFTGMTSVLNRFNMETGKAKKKMDTILHLLFPLSFIACNY